jgi:hypothetical protein
LLKDNDKTEHTSMVPKHIRTYLTLNLALAVLMTVVMAIRTELRTGRFHLIDLFLVAFYSAVLTSIFAGPFAIIEVYLYRRKKGSWYEWKHRKRRSRRDQTKSPEERRYWKNAAYRARASQAGQFPEDSRKRTRLFEKKNAADEVSRPALLMTVADKFEQSGKREAAERCYLQITQRFPESPQAIEAARRLAPATRA